MKKISSRDVRIQQILQDSLLRLLNVPVGLGEHYEEAFLVEGKKLSFEAVYRVLDRARGRPMHIAALLVRTTLGLSVIPASTTPS